MYKIQFIDKHIQLILLYKLYVKGQRYPYKLYKCPTRPVYVVLMILFVYGVFDRALEGVSLVLVKTLQHSSQQNLRTINM